jgi:hypothetical protein
MRKPGSSATINDTLQMNLIRSFVALGFALAALPGAYAQLVTVSSLIPDNDPNGLVSTLDVTTADTAIQSVDITLHISSATGDTAWNGDVYAYLTHESGSSTGFAVLLNRVGVSGSDASGYSNAGFAINLSDSATKDIHAYQNLSPSYDSDGRLTGQWQPDGRNVSPTGPGSTFDTASRSATLNTFSGLNPNGLWVLFIADRALGNEAVLDSWSLAITPVSPVPEPMQMGTVCALGLLTAALWQRKNRCYKVG